MYNISFIKYTTSFSLSIYDEVLDNSLNTKINLIIDNYEKIFSRFLENSELSLLNKNKKGELSPLFFKLLNKTLEINKLTNGYFNPSINLSEIGYGEGKKSEIMDFEESFKLNGNKIEIKDNVSYDFGGIAKGFLVDLISEFLLNSGYKNFILNFGGDIFLSGKKVDGLFNISIESPFDSGNKTIGTLELKDKSISSSGSYKRNWELDGNKYHHILNPINNGNENEIILVSIIGDKTYFTDSIATSVFNMGVKGGLFFLTKNKIDGIIVSSDKKIFFTKDFKEKYNFKIR